MDLKLELGFETLEHHMTEFIQRQFEKLHEALDGRMRTLEEKVLRKQDAIQNQLLYVCERLDKYEQRQESCDAIVGNDSDEFVQIHENAVEQDDVVPMEDSYVLTENKALSSEATQASIVTTSSPLLVYNAPTSLATYTDFGEYSDQPGENPSNGENASPPTECPLKLKNIEMHDNRSTHQYDWTCKTKVVLKFPTGRKRPIPPVYSSEQHFGDTHKLRTRQNFGTNAGLNVALDIICEHEENDCVLDGKCFQAKGYAYHFQHKEWRHLWTVSPSSLQAEKRRIDLYRENSYTCKVERYPKTKYFSCEPYLHSGPLVIYSSNSEFLKDKCLTMKWFIQVQSGYTN